MKIYRYGWIALLVISALACDAIGNIAERANQVESAANTAQALATAGQEFITQVEGSGIMQTAEAMATDVEESGLMETMQAAVTGIPEESSNIIATAQVVITEGAYGEAPSNIPLVDDEIGDFFGSSSLVSYTTPMDLEKVIDFYRQAMPLYGWETGDETTVLTSTYAVLSFKNADQRCTVTLSINPLNGDTFVLISIL